MIGKNIIAFLRIPNLLAQLQVRRDLHTFLRLHFLNAAFESGLLELLQTPTTKDEIVTRLAAQRPDLLDVFLDFGVQLGELTIQNDRYQLRGSRSRALAKPEGDPMAAFVSEYIHYHGSVYRHLPERLKGAPSGDYLEATADLVGRSSRILEPFLGNYVQSIVKKRQPQRLLEVGCGSGVYLRYAAEAHPGLTGAAVDMQEAAVAQTKRNLTTWGVADRFDLFQANIYNPPSQISQQSFDLVTLYNNIYYFQPEERIPLFQTLRSLLAPNGALVLVSMMQGKTTEATNFDIVLRSTIGGAPLPALEEVSQQLHDAGFKQTVPTRLMIGEPFFAILAT